MALCEQKTFYETFSHLILQAVLQQYVPVGKASWFSISVMHSEQIDVKKKQLFKFYCLTDKKL